MPTSIYFYVDGESHYIRSTKCWQALHGPQYTLADVVDVSGPFNTYRNAQVTKAAQRFTHHETGKLFWDAAILERTRAELRECAISSTTLAKGEALMDGVAPEHGQAQPA
jgi:hypothetical protein